MARGKSVSVSVNPDEDAYAGRAEKIIRFCGRNAEGLISLFDDGNHCLVVSVYSTFGPVAVHFEEAS